MGCDGGTIPRRDELVKVKKKPETKDKDSERTFQWRYCSITQQLLQEPIAFCALGLLYNKLALIEALLNRDALPECAQHIKSLKDIKTLNVTPNPEYKVQNENKSNGINGLPSPYICPVIGLEMSGKFRFVALWSCGCAFSERALKEIKTNICHKCQKPFTDEDVVILNGNEDDLVIMKERIQARQLKSKKNKEKKVKVKEEIIEEASTSSSNEKIEKDVSIPTTSTSKIVTQNSNTKLPVKRSGVLDQSKTVTKKIKADYSVAKDPQVSDVYKSIFTTHKSEKEQNRAHWITYNPFYN